MSNFNMFKNISYSVDGTHHSGTIKFKGLLLRKLLRCQKGFCAMCRRNKSRFVSDATIEAEVLKDFLKGVGKATVNFGKKLLVAR